MRNLLATLLLSQGTPMLQGGDEFGRTQKGNNNAYCQDNDISWIDWGLLQKNGAQVEFVRKLTGLRHKYPVLRRSRFLTGEFNQELGVKDVTWINANGSEMEDVHWGDSGMRCFGMLIDGRAQATGVRQQGKDATLLMIINVHHDVVDFKLPCCVGGERWTRMIDTNEEECVAEIKPFAAGDVYRVTSRSLLLFGLDRETAPHSEDGK
jgi:glycogen operon protein